MNRIGIKYLMGDNYIITKVRTIYHKHRIFLA